MELDFVRTRQRAKRISRQSRAVQTLQTGNRIRVAREERPRQRVPAGSGARRTHLRKSRRDNTTRYRGGRVR